MIPDLSLSAAEHQALETFLRSDDVPQTCLDLTGLDGFLAAVVLTPAPLLPSQWLPWVWDRENGEAAPEFSDMAQAQQMMGLLLRYYNAVVSAVDSGEFKPRFQAQQQDGGSELLDAEVWATGFMSGVAIFADHGWRPVLSEHTELVAPMVVLGSAKGRQMLRDSGDRLRAAQDARQAIPDAIAMLHTYFVPQRPQSTAHALPQRRVSAKVGRNDPCPCGSGRKFKKCCGAQGTLH
jgi:uncharacterized protein